MLCLVIAVIYCLLYPIHTHQHSTHALVTYNFLKFVRKHAIVNLLVEFCQKFINQKSVFYVNLLMCRGGRGLQFQFST